MRSTRDGVVHCKRAFAAKRTVPTHTLTECEEVSERVTWFWPSFFLSNSVNCFDFLIISLLLTRVYLTCRKLRLLLLLLLLLLPVAIK